MLTPYLEKLIHQGKASFKTFVCGQSGSNRLPVGDNSWIIITGFTYYNFADPELIQAGIEVVRFEEYLSRSLHQIRFKSSRSNNHYIVKDDIRRDAGDPGSDINQIVNGDFANGSNNWTVGTGWSIAAGIATHVGAFGTGDLTNIGFVSLPGRRYRLTYDVVAITAGFPTVTPFIGGTAGFSRSTVGTFTEEIVGGLTTPLQLFFRGIGAVGENIDIDNIELILLPGTNVVTSTGHSKIDCYLPHQGNVTVELVSFPDNANIIQNLAAAPATFPLTAPPLGYGNAGFGGLLQVIEFRDILFTGPPIEVNSNLPLTRKYTEATPVPPGGLNIVQDGMEIAVTGATQINVPEFFSGEIGPRNFPIIDIQFVEILGTMPEQIRGSK